MDTFEISIKSDNDGFILLQCSLCGEFFKLLASDLNNDSTSNASLQIILPADLTRLQ